MAGTCHVCGKPLDEIYAVNCMGCGRKIHFSTTDDTPEHNCCSIVTQLHACGLAFICNSCSEQQSYRDMKARPQTQ